MTVFERPFLVVVDVVVVVAAVVDLKGTCKNGLSAATSISICFLLVLQLYWKK